MDRPPPARVLIADGNPSLAGVLAELMADEPGFELAGCVDNRREALQLAGGACVDVALVDPRLPDAGSGCLLAELRALCPSAVLLVWSREGDRVGEHVDGRLDRGMTFRELVSAARGALRARRPAAAPLTPADR